MKIQWYPGHMTKTKRMMAENIALVDVVAEILDARIPRSSKNPDIDALAGGKFRVIVLNKRDLADDALTERWRAHFAAKGFSVVTADASSGKGLNDIVAEARTLMADKIARLKSRGRIFVPIRAMIVGVPNVGKSTIINAVTGRATAKVGDKPGVTKGKQWVKLKKDFELLDTPGILWPKFDDQTVGLNLAFTGAINDDIMDTVTLAQTLAETLLKLKPACFSARYGLTDYDENTPPEAMLLKIAEARGFKLKGNEADTLRAAVTLLDEFRGGKLGRITLEVPEELK